MRTLRSPPRDAPGTSTPAPLAAARVAWLPRLEDAGWRAWVEATCVSALVAVLYALTLAGVHGETDDGLYAAVQVRNGDPDGLFVPSHIVYNWLAWAVFNAFAVLGYDGGPLLPMQLLDSALGALGIGLLWWLLRRTVSLTAAVVACSLVAFSYGYWFYSVSVEVYVLSAVLLICALGAAYRAASFPGTITFGVLGAAYGLAVLGHSTNVLFGTVVLAALWMVLQHQPRTEVVRYALVCGATAIAVVLPVYGAAAVVLDLSTPREVYLWYTEITRAGDWGAFTAETLPKAVLGAGRALVGGHFLLAIDAVRETVESAFGGQNPREERFLTAAISPALALLLIVPVVLVVAGLGASVVGWLRRPTLPARSRRLARLCMAWLASYVPFFVWWEPLNIEFWIAVWVPAAILVALPFGTPAITPPRLRFVMAIGLVVSLFFVNFLGSILPQRDESNDYWRTRVAWYEDNTVSADLIVTAGHLWTSYVEYFAPAQTVDLFALQAQPDSSLESLLVDMEQRVQSPDGGRILVSSEVFYPGRYEVACCIDAAGATDAGALLRDAFRERLRPIQQGPFEWVWEITAE